MEKSTIFSGTLDYNIPYNNTVPTTDEHLAFGKVTTAIKITHEPDGRFYYVGAVGDSYNFERHLLNMDFASIMNELAYDQQINRVIIPFPWIAYIEGEF